MDREGIVAAPSRRLVKLPPSKSKGKGAKKGNDKRRTLQTLSGPTSYVDSGWSESEWRMIAAAMRRYQRTR